MLILAPYLAPYEVNKNFKGGYLIIDFCENELGAMKKKTISPSKMLFFIIYAILAKLRTKSRIFEYSKQDLYQSGPLVQ